MQAFNGFLGKTDGRDKLCATIQVCASRQQAACAQQTRLVLMPCMSAQCRSAILTGMQQPVTAATDHRFVCCVLTTAAAAQYALMFIANGEPGNVRKAMASVAAARKVFRVFRVRLSSATQPALHPSATSGPCTDET